MSFQDGIRQLETVMIKQYRITSKCIIKKKFQNEIIHGEVKFLLPACNFFPSKLTS